MTKIKNVIRISPVIWWWWNQGWWGNLLT